jgi:hypothetical protein
MVPEISPRFFSHSFPALVLFFPGISRFWWSPSATTKPYVPRQKRHLALWRKPWRCEENLGKIWGTSSINGGFNRKNRGKKP